MSASSDAGTRYSSTAPPPGCLVAYGVFQLALAAAVLGVWYFDWRERARAEDSLWREAERVASVYEALARDPLTKKPEPGDPLAQNHQEMARLLAGGRPGRRTSDVQHLVMLLVMFGGFGVLALVSGLRARSRGAIRPAVESGPSGLAPGEPPPGPSSRDAEPSATPGRRPSS